MSDRVGIALLGYGTVGKGVVQILRDQAARFEQRTGVTFDLRHVVVRDLQKHRSESEKAEGVHRGLPFTTDAQAAINDPDVKIVVEVMGGIDPAAKYLADALKLGKHVITANKSLLAEKGPALFATARTHHACIAFEASCGGGIPIVESLTRGLLANRIDALVGIVNGTCNAILTRMTKNGWTYAQALAEAQSLGFAEADPTLDVSGADAAQKLALLAGLAFDARINPRDIHLEGITTLEPLDIKFAGELGYVVKLLAIGERTTEGKLVLRVHPTLVHHTDVLAEVSGGFNAISVYGNALGHALFYGRGAGSMPTASAVVSDLLSVGIGAAPAAFAKLRIYPDCVEQAMVEPIGDLRSRYYLRLLARDVPGTIAQISNCLGRHGISISAILQREDNGGKFVPIVITTHIAIEGNVAAALAEIDQLACIQPATVKLRIIDQPREFAES
ncbi:MAG TPA: homoserine dehydrogenase [Tepidisphaeraceae bacterium]|nr:homoserine dehydrogenase [Tepidisphaeraceae bacterium]